jgi:competence protein ComEC
MQAVAFTLGIVLLQQFQWLPRAIWLLPAIVSMLIFYRMKLSFPAWFVLGFIWAFLSAQLGLSNALDEALEGKDIDVKGVVTSIPEPFTFGTRFLFQIDTPLDQRLRDSIPSKIRLGWYQDYPDIRVGQQWQLTVRLKRANGMMNPGGFDYEGWLFEKGIRATGYVRASGSNSLLGEVKGVKASMGRVRQQLDEQIEAALAGSSVVGIVKALAIGSRKMITPEQWEIFRKTGTSHLVAISGLHIGLVAALVFFLVRRGFAFGGMSRIAPYQLAAAASIVAAALYAALADFSLPTQRALLMVGVVMLAIIWRRGVYSMHTFSIALIGVLLLNPFAVNSASFWLSFGAVSLIVYLSAGRCGREKGLLKSQRIHFILALGLTPLLLLFFQQTSVIAPLANLVAIPLVGLLVVPATLLALLLFNIVPEVSQLLLVIATSCLDGLITFLAFLSHLTWADWVSSAPKSGAVVLAVVAVFVLFAPAGFPSRWLAIILFLPIIFVRQPLIEKGDFKMTLLDVGQGLSVVVQTASHLLVFDTGSRIGDRFDLGSMVVVPYVRSIGWSKVDKLIISHGDLDHRGGAKAVVDQLVVGELLASTRDKLEQFDLKLCKSGQYWEWDGVSFSILNPLDEVSESENNHSCVLQVRSSAGTLLLTGDIEKEAEKRLVTEYGERLKSDVLIVPHHGSKTSSSAGFIAAVNPHYAFFPVGYRNRFGFPAESVVARYQQQNIKLMDTVSQGAITVQFRRQSGVGQPVSFRVQEGHYWNRGRVLPESSQNQVH